MRLLAALGIVALLAVGCSKGSAPTQQQFAGAADSACTATHAELEKTAAAHRKTKPDGGANQRFVRAKLIAALRAMTGQLRGIKPPDGDGGYLSSVYRDYEHALDVWYSDPLGSSSDKARQAAEGRMKNYGMKACASAAEIQVDDDTSG